MSAGSADPVETSRPAVAGASGIELPSARSPRGDHWLRGPPRDAPCYFAQMTTTEIESFHEAGAKVGALIRHLSKDLLRTTLAFRVEGGPVVHLFQETRFAPDVFEWSAYRYVDHLQNSTVEVRAAELPPRRDIASTPIPSYAAHLVLRDFLETTAPQRLFSQFHEDDPAATVSAAFVRHGTETIQTPQGPRDALKVVLEVDGRAGNTFWCIDGAPVKSDWQGATSYAATDTDSVLRGLDTEVLSILKLALTGIE